MRTCAYVCVCGRQRGENWQAIDQESARARVCLRVCVCVCVCECSFPAQNGECFENVRDKFHLLDEIHEFESWSGLRISVPKSVATGAMYGTGTTRRQEGAKSDAAKRVFPRKMANVLKMFATNPIRYTIGSTAAVFYPNWRTSRVHYKKGRPRAATSHESRPGNPSFGTFDVRTRLLVRC